MSIKGNFYLSLTFYTCMTLPNDQQPEHQHSSQVGGPGYGETGVIHNHNQQKQKALETQTLPLRLSHGFSWWATTFNNSVNLMNQLYFFLLFTMRKKKKSLETS